MRKCRDKQKNLALLAVNALGREESGPLREHLDCCQECQAYFLEIKAVTTRIEEREAQLHSEAPCHSWDGFHQRLMKRIIKGERISPPERMLAWVRGVFMEHRVGFAVGALALVLLALWVSQMPPRPTRHSTVATQTRAEGEKIPKDVEPSASNYQWVASRSLEQLDELLTRQANQAGNQDVIYRAGSSRLTSD